MAQLVRPHSLNESELVNLNLNILVSILTLIFLATLYVNVHKIKFWTKPNGPVIFEVWDTAGQEKFGGLRDGYYINAQAAMFMFDLTAYDTYTNIETWYRDVTRIVGSEIPMVLIGNKCDHESIAVQPSSVRKILSLSIFHHLFPFKPC